MIKSMTGFGKGEAAVQNKKFTVELRSLNSKQLDINLRLPPMCRRAECDVRNLITKNLQRGKIDAFITCEATSSQTAVHINKEVFGAYYKHLAGICTESGIPNVTDSAVSGALIQSILRFTDVASTDGDTLSDEELTALLTATEQAVDRLNEFRTQEGAILAADLLHRIDKIETCKQEIIPFEKARTEAIRNRILDNMAKLPVEVDPNRLEQEMIFYMEKLDITEEKVRLSNHCSYFREVAAHEECAGRKLGFIAQEMGREINTLGSKANDANMQMLVVRMKDELEKIKEQVLNLL